MKIISQLFDALINRRIKKSARPLGWSQPKAIACWTCEISHELPPDLRQGIASAEDFFTRHKDHNINWFEAPGLAGLWTPNADVKEAYGSSAAYTITLTSLATSASLIAGQQSTTVPNTSNLYSNYLVGGRITSGTTPTVDTTIEVHVFGSINDTPTYPDQFTGTDAARSVTSVNVKKSAVKLLDRLFVDATTAQVNWFGPIGVSQFFAWRLPKLHGIWVTHNCVQALHATPGNHVISHTGVFNTVI